MNLESSRRTRPACRRIASLLLTAFMLVLTLSTVAQQPQLTLADLLIGLRSKKVTLFERNAILTEAVKQRGVTFTLYPEIEKELSATGAAKNLLDAIREKSVAAVVQPPAPVATPVPTPAPTPIPQDFAFFQTRADLNLGKGEYSLALADYDRAVELKADDAIAFLNRGRTHYNLNAFDKAVADYDRAIALDPKGSRGYYNRGVLFERLGKIDNAIADYQKAVDLDPANETAKTGLKKLQSEQMAKAAALAPPKPEPTAEPVKVPESINLGNLSAANAIAMVTPVYSPNAQKMRIEGRVVVEIQLDEEGNVVSAKAVSGHQMLQNSAEQAARRSKFKPAMFGSQPVKATGSITYNFTLNPTR